MIDDFEKQIMIHQPLVISIAARIHKTLPKFIAYEDVLAYGQMGLTQAANTYESKPGAQFSTFAYYRITGAIYDGIARMNWSTRAQYRHFKSLQMASEVVAEVAERSGCDGFESNADWFVDSVQNLSVVYLFSAATNESPIENQLVGDACDPADIAAGNELGELLLSAIEKLPTVERELICKTYYEGMSLAEASESLGRSRSWGSRTHLKILKTLGQQLGAESTATCRDSRDVDS